jgi:hypothetical protein
MNRADAAAILNIDPAASPEETRRAYQELFTEHQFRLTNAPTPGLKSLYQSRLRELDEARDILLAQEPTDATLDLPTDQPSLPPRSGETPAGSAGGTWQQPPSQRPPPVSKEKPASPEKSAAVETAHLKPQPGPTVSPRPGPSRALILAGVAAVILIGGFLYYRSASAPSAPACANPPCAAAPNETNAFYPDSLPALRENVTLARVELQRPEPNFPIARKSIEDAERLSKGFPSSAGADTSIAGLKLVLSQQRSKLNRLCDALRKVAERRHEDAPPGCV